MDLTDLSGMRVSGAPPLDVPDSLAFHFTGRGRANTDAKMLLEFRMASLREMKKLRGVKGPPFSPPIIVSSRDGDSSTEQTDYHESSRSASNKI